MYNCPMTKIKAEKHVTQKEVAERAGVTRSMVSYVLNGTNRSVAPETRQKILDAIKELKYRPNKNAQALLAGEESLAQKQIGVILPNSATFLRPYYTEILSGIYDATHNAGCHVRFIRFFEDLKNPILFNHLIHTEEIGSIVLLALDQVVKTSEDYEILQNIKERIENVVCVDWQMEGFSSVLFNRDEAAYQAAQHLIKRGYGVPAYIGQNDQRITGLRRAAKENDENSAEKLSITEAFDMKSGYIGMKNLAILHNAQGTPLPRCILAGSDEIAVGILRFLTENDIDVPEQLALISIDNLESAEFASTPLTAVNVPKKAMGEKAVELLVRQSTAVSIVPQTIMLPTNIIERSSC